jgi:hypothetical protein
MASLNRVLEQITALGMVATVLGAATGCAQRQVFWPGTPEYVSKTVSFRLNEEDAYKLILQSDVKPRLLDNKPTFVTSNDYFFSEPRKHGGVALTGHYVNGHTGTVVYRTSRHTISYGARTLPTGVYD